MPAATAPAARPLDCADAIVDAGPPPRDRGARRRSCRRGRGARRDIAGMAVHIAARASALAGPSEVLESSTLHEIVTGSRREFTEHGEHDLKGVPGRWRGIQLCTNRIPPTGLKE